jgi:hypothetical protein
MKNIFIKVLSILAIGYGMTSCLDGDPQNTPYGGSPTLVEMTYISPTSANINSGLQYFSAQTLLLNPAHDADTITFAATVQGSFDEDVNVTLKVDQSRLADNKKNDALDYTLMTENTQYQFLSKTGVIHPGTAPYTEFKVVFFPKNIDFTKSYMLPVSVTNDKDVLLSSNFGTLYFHVIGNPLAGLYSWKFSRYDTPDGSGPLSSFSFDFGNATYNPAVFIPSDPTTITTLTGYAGEAYYYIITFDDDGAGHLTNFKAVIDPATVNGAWKDSNIVITDDPVITVSPDYTSIKIHYHVKSGASALDRDITDEYIKL